MHDGVRSGDEPIDDDGVADVADVHAQPGVVGHRVEVGAVAGVGERVEDDHLVGPEAVVATLQNGADVVAADEAGTARDEQTHENS